MANALYDHGRQAFAEGAINLPTDSITAVLVNIASGHYTVDLAAHQYLSSIVSGDRVAISSAFSSKSDTAGVFNAANVTFSAVTGSAAGAIVIFKDTGTDTTSPLIAYMDTGTGLPVTPNGGDISITWDTGSNKIFKL